MGARERRQAAIAAKVAWLYGGNAPYPSKAVLDRYRTHQRQKYGGRGGHKNVPKPYESWEHIGYFLDTELSADEEESASWPIPKYMKNKP
jgi:hypothetical protein